MRTKCIITILTIFSIRSYSYVLPTVDVNRKAEQIADIVATANVAVEIAEEITNDQAEVELIREIEETLREINSFNRQIAEMDSDLRYLLDYDINKYDDLNMKLSRLLRLIQGSKRFYKKVALFTSGSAGAKAATIKTSRTTEKIYEELVRESVKKDNEKQQEKAREARKKVEENRALDKEVAYAKKHSKNSFGFNIVPTKIVPTSREISTDTSEQVISEKSSSFVKSLWPW